MMSARSSFQLVGNSELIAKTDLSDAGLLVEIILVDFPHDHDIIVHWGATFLDQPRAWTAPTSDLPAFKHFVWSPDTKLTAGAANTPFKKGIADNYKSVSFLFAGVSIDTPLFELPATLEFVLHCPPDVWIKNGKNNFSVDIASFLQTAFLEDRLLSAAKSVLQDRLVKTTQQLVHKERWTVNNANVSFTLLGYAFSENDDAAFLYFFTDTSHPILLHWGLDDGNDEWTRADVTQLQSGDGSEYDFVSHPWDDKALQTQFQFLRSNGSSPLQFLRLILKSSIVPGNLKFVIKELHANTWLKNNSLDFVMKIPHNPNHIKAKLVRKNNFVSITIHAYRDAEDSRRLAEQKRAAEHAAVWKKCRQLFVDSRDSRRTEKTIVLKSVSLSESVGDVDIIVDFDEENAELKIMVITCASCKLVLHWGVVGQAGNLRRFGGQEWQCPPEKYRPVNTIVSDPARSCETTFSKCTTVPVNGGLTEKEAQIAAEFFQDILIKIPAQSGAPGSNIDAGVNPEIGGLVCVFREFAGGRWFKSVDGRDTMVRLTSTESTDWKGYHAEVAEEILSAEVGWHHMTLMHRCNLINASVSRWHENRQKVSSNPALLRSWTSIFHPSSNSTEIGVTSTPGQTAPLPHKLRKGTNVEGDAILTQSDKEFWAWIFVWGRFSFIGLLDWQRNYNTKPKDLAHATECLTYKLSDLWVSWPQYRPFIRLVLSTVTRGGNQGQAIRDRILDIMHRNKLPEDNSNFFEQWHQKLHNNTTSDDIAICQAIIRFLKTGGNKGEYWNVLRAHNIGKDKLESYERKIVAEPYMPHGDTAALCYDFEQYLEILKDVHDSLDLKKAFEHAVRFLPHDAIDAVRDVVNNTHVSGVALKKTQGMAYTDSTETAHWRFQSIVHARRRIIHQLRHENKADAARELLFLDFALEQQQVLALLGERLNFNTPQLAEQLRDMLVNLSGHDPCDDELHAIASDWVSLSHTCAQNNFSTAVESALMLKALADRVELYVGRLVHEWQGLFGPRAEYLGLEVGVDQKILNVFVDEVLRGTALFSISITLKRLEPQLRAAASLPPWQLISVVPTVQGVVKTVDKLINIQHKVFPEPTILLSGAVSGEEEIPAGVQAVLVRSAAESPDILSHVAVRARNGHLLLAVCYVPDIASALEKFVGKWVKLEVQSEVSRIEFQEISLPCGVLQRSETRQLLSGFDRAKTQSKLVDDLILQGHKADLSQIDLQGSSANWVITPDEFNRSLVGSKSLNLLRLRDHLPKTVIIPHAVALPYGCFQKTLGHASNEQTRLLRLTEILKGLTKESSNEDAQKIFIKAKEICHELAFPEEFRTELEKSLTEKSNSDRILWESYKIHGHDAAWQAICGVWASLFGLRPWVSLSRAGRSYYELNMAVLIQELLPADYAFVLHSRNPFKSSATENEMYGEIVIGLGEVLVGNAPGRALSWIMKPEKIPVVLSFPSKTYALKGQQCIIYRSDSNGEDLEGFAGAGLFESIPAVENIKISTKYNSSKLICDREYRQQLLQKIGQLAFDIEKAFGRPMDIEGVVLENDVLGVVQARPQSWI